MWKLVERVFLRVCAGDAMWFVPPAVEMIDSRGQTFAFITDMTSVPTRNLIYKATTKNITYKY